MAAKRKMDEAARDEDLKARQKHKSGESTLSSDTVDVYIPTPPDGGYGWVIVAASFMNHVIVDGIAFTFGVFYVDFLDYFKSGSGRTAFIGSLLSGCYLLSAPIAGSLVNKFGCRSVGFVGAVIATLSFCLCTLCKEDGITAMMITYGVLGGFGLGLLYLPNIVAVSYYFQRRRAVATGIAVCGAGVGCFVLAPLCQYLLDEFAWQTAMMIVAGITLHGCIFSALLRPLEPPRKSHAPRRKNILDRVRERCRLGSGSGVRPEEMDRIEFKKQKLHIVKLAREDALTREEAESEVVAVPAVTIQVSSDGDGKPVDSAEHERLLQESTFEPKPGSEDAKPVDKKLALLGPSTTGPGNTRCASDLCIAPHKKLPHGVHKEDYKRPLYRRDIFYSGSIIHIPEFSSQPNIVKFNRSITSIPADTGDERRYKIFCCIPVSKSAYDTFQEMTDLSLLRDPLFFIPCLTNLCGAVGLFIPFVYMTKRAISDYDIQKENAAFLLSIVGITNTVGRILAGWLADLKWVNSLLLHNMALILGGLACILHMFCVEYISMCVFAAFFGLCIATWISLTSIVLCNLLGLQKLTNAFGLLTMTRGIASLIGSPIAGFVKDQTQTYDASFIVGGVMLLIGGLLCCILHLPRFAKNAPEDEQEKKDAPTDIETKPLTKNGDAVLSKEREAAANNSQEPPV